MLFSCLAEKSITGGGVTYNCISLMRPCMQRYKTYRWLPLQAAHVNSRALPSRAWRNWSLSWVAMVEMSLGCKPRLRRKHFSTVRSKLKLDHCSLIMNAHMNMDPFRLVLRFQLFAQPFLSERRHETILRSLDLYRACLKHHECVFYCEPCRRIVIRS